MTRSRMSLGLAFRLRPKCTFSRPNSSPLRLPASPSSENTESRFHRMDIVKQRRRFPVFVNLSRMAATSRSALTLHL